MERFKDKFRLKGQKDGFSRHFYSLRNTDIKSIVLQRSKAQNPLRSTLTSIPKENSLKISQFLCQHGFNHFYKLCSPFLEISQHSRYPNLVFFQRKVKQKI
jgi:hypothetical protein